MLSLLSALSSWLLLMDVASASTITNFANVACGRGAFGGRAGSGRRVGKIVGGGDAFPGEFPWIVSITRRGGHFCGGTLIAQRWVLTAAHCLCSGGIKLGAGELKVVAGGHDLRSQTNGLMAPVAQVILHPHYTCSRYVNDIALLELAEPISWSEWVKPACLPPRSTGSFSEASAVVAGWGWTAESSDKSAGGGGRANVLQKVHLTVVDNNQCRDWYKSQGKKVKILDTQMCAGTEKGGKDSCWADSGGPLMVGEGSDTLVVGIVSTGIGCARPRLPGLYTRVSDYVPWIEENLKSSS